MYLSKLEIQGFKSFAEKAVLEFNHDLTAIVGPNGSGKSNIADAVRWVLGEQSLKLLRGKKSEDVIFAGSGKRTRLGYAEVSLYLNNEDGQVLIDYREVVITRRIYRDGESEYLINKNKVRLTDIQLLLAKSNFGQKTYSIIGQGMVDSILTSSPEERKEFFDEATGVRQYQIKKEQAINKLERSRENLGQSQQVLLEIEPRLRSLTRQVKRLEKKEELARELNELQTKYYSRIQSDLNNEESLLKEKLEKIENEKKNLEVKIATSQRAIEEIQVQDTEAMAFQKLQNQYSDLNRQKHQLLKEQALVKGKMDLELTKLGKADIVWAQNKNEEINHQANQLSFEIKENIKLIENLEGRLKEKINSQQQVLSEYQALQKQLTELNSLSKKDQLSLAKIQTHLAALYQKQQEFLDSLVKFKDLNQLPKLERQAEEIGQEIRWLLNKLDDGQSAESADLLKIQEKLNQFLTTKDSLVNEIQELKVNLEVTKQKNQHLISQEQSLQSEKKKIELELNFDSQSANQDLINQSLKNQQDELEFKIKELNQGLEKLQKQLDDFSKNQEQSKNQLFASQRLLRDLQIQINGLNNESHEIQINLAKIETRKEDLEKEIAKEIAGDFNSQSPRAEINLGETFAEISRLKNQLAVIGGIDEEVVKEFREVKERYVFLNEQVTDLEQAINSCHKIIEELDKKIKEQFEAAFEKINQEFINYFKILFNGGTARLLLCKKEVKIKEEEDVPELKADEKGINDGEEVQGQKTSEKKNYEIGIDIQATPPGKKVKSLNMLSGGEKALTSIALICAIISNNPSPFVILDEVDAALDEANSERFVKIIDKLSDKTQFICITHNRATMQQAAILYGVTMGNDGVSKLLSVNLVEAEKVAE